MSLCATVLLSQSTEEAVFTGEQPFFEGNSTLSTSSGALHELDAVADNIEELALTREQYCLGCINTIDLYGSVLKEQLLSLYKKKVAEGELIAGNGYIDKLCEHKSLSRSKVQEHVRYSCYKVIHQYRRALLDTFQGQTNANTIDAKIFTAKHFVCQNVTQACPKAFFTSSLITSNKERRNKCTACRIVANDMDNRLRVLKKDIKKIDWEKDVGHKICSKLINNHNPYAWLENVCEYITDEDNSKKFKEIMVDRYQFLTTLDDSIWVPPLEESICKAFYKCDPPPFRDIYSEPLLMIEKPITPDQVETTQEGNVTGEANSVVPVAEQEEL